MLNIKYCEDRSWIESRDNQHGWHNPLDESFGFMTLYDRHMVSGVAEDSSCLIHPVISFLKTVNIIYQIIFGSNSLIVAMEGISNLLCLYLPFLATFTHPSTFLRTFLSLGKILYCWSPSYPPGLLFGSHFFFMVTGYNNYIQKGKLQAVLEYLEKYISMVRA